jgi:flagellar basal body-associated protein FliL
MPEQQDEQLVTEALTNSSSSGESSGMLKSVLVGVVVVLVAAAAGGVIGKLIGASPETASAGQAEVPPETEKKQDGDLVYFDMEPITVNLNEPRLARYIRATLSLAINKKDNSKANEVIQQKMPELKNWLILYLADCSLDEVRGARNLSRILREIQDCFNEMLWPDGRPLITRVDYKEWAVQ